MGMGMCRCNMGTCRGAAAASWPASGDVEMVVVFSDDMVEAVISIRSVSCWASDSARGLLATASTVLAAGPEPAVRAEHKAGLVTVPVVLCLRCRLGAMGALSPDPLGPSLGAPKGFKGHKKHTGATGGTSWLVRARIRVSDPHLNARVVAMGNVSRMG